MDAKDDTDLVVSGDVAQPIPKQDRKKPKISIKMEKPIKTKADSADVGVSAEPAAEVQGQMYLWDISEEPNVVLRQSELEECLFKILTDEAGVPKHIYEAIVKSFMRLTSPRFQRSIFFYMERIDALYRFNPQKRGIPAEQEIWS
jgi:hypothetical protein